MKFWSIQIIVLLVTPLTAAFCTHVNVAQCGLTTKKLKMSAIREDTPSISRRDLFETTASLAAILLVFQPSLANAIPMATNDEFSTLLRDSSLSIQVVEFSGPKSETVVVKLVDGTTFGIKDVVESSTDPRSPLKIAAACRESGVKTKFVDLESLLAASPKRKKMYTNQRVQDAQEKEREKQERIRRDEEERLAQLQKMEEKAAKK